MTTTFKPKAIPAGLQPIVDNYTKFWVGCKILGMSVVDYYNFRLWYSDPFGLTNSQLVPYDFDGHGHQPLMLPSVASTKEFVKENATKPEDEPDFVHVR